MVEVIFDCADGTQRRVNAAVGDSVMDAALDNGVPGIIAQCGGGCTCCTCHCWVLGDWHSRLPMPHQDELDLLEYAAHKRSNSRLSCQIRITSELDGLHVGIPPEQA